MRNEKKTYADAIGDAELYAIVLNIENMPIEEPPIEEPL